VNRESPDAGDIRRLQGAQYGVLQKAFAHTLALPPAIHRQSRQQHDRYGMLGQAFRQPGRCAFVFDFPDRKSVKSYHDIARQPDIGLRSARLLILQRIPLQKPVQLLAAAIEVLDGMVSPELFNTAGSTH